ncbi:hypothetical protein [Marinithermus hydrothermalis]|uniref:Uncharacterized protein n=1 Tax=Marinithermus hydrothermalis (strain DSM 14884 / JCM 11576 / T1) TaxID=869210 RepID=F2NLS4_MARHT|nr:hypothetical protein [Marinithermus hydrothermalis]AEB10904.1 hypothetical protein Marky_0141 [Marinithermus hydrothermalis DSM 14884]
MRRLIVLITLSLLWGSLAWAQTGVAVKIPEILRLYVNGLETQQVPVTVHEGRVTPEALEILVIANTSWTLVASSTPLVGPTTLPPERLRLGGVPLSAAPRVLTAGRGAWRARLPLTVRLVPGDPEGTYRSVITLQLARP